MVNCLRCGWKLKWEMYRPQGRCTNLKCPDNRDTAYVKEKKARG